MIGPKVFKHTKISLFKYRQVMIQDFDPCALFEISFPFIEALDTSYTPKVFTVKKYCIQIALHTILMGCQPINAVL